MTLPTIQYANILTKQVVENWADEKGFSVEEQIRVHMEQLFEVNEILILDAKNEGDHLMLTVSTHVWPESREFALLSNGSLAW